MARSQQTFGKKEREKQKQKKKQDKRARREERKAEVKDGSLENMMAYIDEFGNITDTPPDPEAKKKQQKIDAANIEINVPKQEDIEEEDPIKEGKVTYFNDSKGYGFIKDLKSQDDFFVHINSAIDPIEQGDKVTFEVEQGLKGPAAVRVKKVE